MAESEGTYGLPERRASDGKAAVFKLTAIDRTDHPGGARYTPPGGPATKMLGCADTGEDVNLSVLFEPLSKFILYSIEDISSPSPFLVFIEMESPRVKELLICEEAFIDRGARRVAAVGCRVLVVSLQSAWNFLKTAALDAPIEKGEWKLSVVWNTGRCGSTLMHKALLACGVCSFSEPQWMDQLGMAKAEAALTTQAIKVCWVFDMQLMKTIPPFTETTMFSMCAKGNGLAALGQQFAKAFPDAQPCFMYRSCDKVAESFESIEASLVPAEVLAEKNNVWKQKRPGMVVGMMLDKFKAIAGELPLGSIESFGVARRIAAWLNGLDSWRTLQACSELYSMAPVVRMDEFVTKDLAKREAVLAELLLRMKVLDGSQRDLLQKALEVFNVDSQKNSSMGSSAKAKEKFALSDEQRNAIFECIAKAGPLINGLIVENGGANVIMPGSLGVQPPVANTAKSIMYTYTDEAPMLATHAFYPIIKAFCAHADIDVQLKDISVAGRVLAQFPDCLKDDQRVDDILMQLGKLAQSGQANIIKLPNVSASIPQLKECIKELQSQGFAIPDYPEEPKDDTEKDVKTRYAKVLGSAVNPVLREGNSDRRAAVPVKEYAFRYPHSMGKWAPDSRTSIRCMKDGDFYSHERSVRISTACEARIEHVSAADGSITVLRPKLPLQKGEVLDASYLDCELLCDFFEECIQEAQAADVLFSVHLKATMMKVSDPIIFGHCVKVYFKDVFAKYKDIFATLGVNANNGLGDLYKKIATLPEVEKKSIEDDIMATYAKRGKMAMVDGGRGITNLHVPSDIIIDNSLPTAIRGGGKMWNTADKEEDFLGTVPDRAYGKVFDECVEFCKKNGAFDPRTMGACPNVGLMAQKAEEYGSHPNTFEAQSDGTIRIVVNGTDQVLLGHAVRKGDIYRACQTRDAPIKDWVKLAVNRCRANNFPNNGKPCKAIFWLDSARTHDVILIDLVKKYLPEFKPEGLDIEVMSPVEAMRVTLQRAKDGLNTITVTGNVLRDYLTDLFPILELGTSAKMLSIVPMLTGGAMYETGAGGSAPKHVQQFQKEGHLRWDSLGEYLALSCAFVDLGESNPRAKVMAAALDKAVGSFLTANKNPSRKVREIDNRGSHYWVARYWAEELAAQHEDSELKETFSTAAKQFGDMETKILEELIECQGKPADIGGYYRVDKAKADALMNPSITLNRVISHIEQGPDARVSGGYPGLKA